MMVLVIFQEVIREMALKVIVELVYNHMSRFVNHEELILSSVIEARKDPSQAVSDSSYHVIKYNITS